MASLWESGASCTIRTRSVERVVAPIAAQVCRLIVGGGGGGRGEAPAPLEEAAGAVAAAMRRLAAVASRLAEESEDDILRKEMGTATDCVVASGQNLLLAAQKLNIQPTSPDHREELIISAQNVLLGTLKILLVEDDAAVREIVTAAHWLLDCLTELESALDIPSLLKSFRGFSEALLLLNNLAERRLEELRDPAQQRNLVRSLETLKKCISMLYTAMHTTIKHPQNEQARAAKKYVLDQADTSITELILLLQSNFSENTSASQGYYIEKLQGLLQLLSSSSCSSIRGSDFDSLLRDLVIYCMVVANTSRKERQLIVIKYCQRVLHHWSEISRQAKLLGNSPDSKQLQQDIEDNCVSMKNELQNLDNSILTAILYQSVDVFTAPNTLFEKLISVATESTNDSSELDHLQPPLTAFLAHADRVIQVAGFISACSTSTKNIMNIESSRTRLKQLKDSIVPSLLELGKTSLCSEALGKLQELYWLWAEEVDQLLGSLTDVINIKQLLDLCIQELMNDKRECEKAHTSQSASQFEEHSVRLIGLMNYVVITAKRHVDKSDNPVFRNGLLVLIKQVENSIISPISDFDCALRTAPQESIAMLYSKLKKAQANAKHLLEVVSALPVGSDRLEGPCILWSLSVQVLLNSLDKLLGSETLNNKGQCFDHTVTPQKRLVIFSENSLRIQEAARLSTFICKDNNINKKIVDLQKEVQVLTEAYLQSADGLSRIPLSNINLFAQSELLQRKLQIKMKMLCALIGMINKDYEETIKNILHLSILASTGNKDEKILAQRNFEREAEQLLQNIKVTSQNVQDCLNYIRDPRVRLNLKFINEHLSFETTDIISRAREVIETQNFHEIPSLEIRVKDWSAKANYLVTEIYKVNEIHQETKNLIRLHLQCRSLMEAHNVSAENSFAHNRQKKPEGNTVSSWQTKNPVNSDKEDIHRPPIQKREPEKDSNAPIREIRTSSTSVSLTDTALFLKKETDKWQDENNKVVQVTKEMAAQIYYMVQYLKKKGPIKAKDEFIASAKRIAASGQLISKFVQIIADHCLDRHCSTELTHTVEQILAISNQLNIISRLDFLPYKLMQMLFTQAVVA
ncbi:CTNA1 protein, partial [Atractosteus spatula]|nr:CTNA1 protein [Atractosteus spatula]